MFFQYLELSLRLHTASPMLPMNDVFEHVAAAHAAATDRVSPELLLGIAFIESRYVPSAVSRVERGRRRTGRYDAMTPPAGWDSRTSLFCGPLQTYAESWERCLEMRQLDVAYAAAVDELERWLRDKRVRGNIRLALAGHGCGNHGVTTGRCNGYPARVLHQERRIRYGIEPANKKLRRRTLASS